MIWKNKVKCVGSSVEDGDVRSHITGVSPQSPEPGNKSGQRWDFENTSTNQAAAEATLKEQKGRGSHTARRDIFTTRVVRTSP